MRQLLLPSAIRPATAARAPGPRRVGPGAGRRTGREEEGLLYLPPWKLSDWVYRIMALLIVHTLAPMLAPRPRRVLPPRHGVPTPATAGAAALFTDPAGGRVVGRHGRVDRRLRGATPVRPTTPPAPVRGAPLRGSATRPGQAAFPTAQRPRVLE